MTGSYQVIFEEVYKNYFIIKLRKYHSDFTCMIILRYSQSALDDKHWILLHLLTRLFLRVNSDVDNV